MDTGKSTLSAPDHLRRARTGQVGGLRGCRRRTEHRRPTYLCRTEVAAAQDRPRRHRSRRGASSSWGRPPPSGWGSPGGSDFHPVTMARERPTSLVIDTTAGRYRGGWRDAQVLQDRVVPPRQGGGVAAGTEMEPIVGMLRRFFSAEVIVSGVDPEVLPVAPDQRAARAPRLADAFAPPWSAGGYDRPSSPRPFRRSRPPRLHGVLVGVQDGTGPLSRLGVLEFSRMCFGITNVGGGDGAPAGIPPDRPRRLHQQADNLQEMIFGLERGGPPPPPRRKTWWKTDG